MFHEVKKASANRTKISKKNETFMADVSYSSSLPLGALTEDSGMIGTGLAVRGDHDEARSVLTSKTDLTRSPKNPGCSSEMPALSGEGDGEFVVTMIEDEDESKCPCRPHHRSETAGSANLRLNPIRLERKS